MFGSSMRNLRAIVANENLVRCSASAGEGQESMIAAKWLTR